MFNRKYVPYSTLIELTLKCNMRCVHCGSSAGYTRKDELSTNEWMNVIRQLSNLKCKLVTLLGGEPFMRKDWDIISREIRDQGMDLTIISNGLCIDDSIIKKLRYLGLYTIAISLDGASPATHDYIRQVKGSFVKCKGVLKSLKEADIPTSVVTTLNKTNLKDLPSLRELLLNKGIAWQIQIGVPIGRFTKDQMLSEEEFYAAALFISSTRKQYTFKELPITGAHCFGYNSSLLPNIMLSPWRGCQAGISGLGIQSDGMIKGCLSLTDEFIEGNIKKDKIEEIWNNANAFSYNRKFTTKNLKNGCKDCKYGKNCKGGCLSVSTSLTNQANSDPYCLYLIEKDMKI